MSKPEFSKEFSAKHAKAGAPYCMRSGEAVEILKWDSANEQPLIGIIGPSDTIQRWFASGQWGLARSSDNDLVMLPLGMIDGKPVFVGDEYLGYADTPCVAGPGMSSDYSGCRWPAPARIYPVTQMGEVELMNAAFSKAHGTMIINGEQACGIANAALRHAVDNGYLVTPEEANANALEHLNRGADEHKTEIADLHSKWVAQITEMNGKRAERDMAVAEAVRQACWDACAVNTISESKVAALSMRGIIGSMPS